MKKREVPRVAPEATSILGAKFEPTRGAAGAKLS